jgi:hypothetical protein
VAVSINWATRVITIPQSFHVALGGMKYRLDVNALRNALKDIEDDESGMAYPDTHRHAAESTLSGVTYARQFEVINGYTLAFQNTGTPYVVTCEGANHNIADVTNFDGGVSLIIGNSAGLIAVNAGGGSGPSASDIAAAVLAALQATTIPANMVLINGQGLSGSGTEASPWGPA